MEREQFHPSMRIYLSDKDCLRNCAPPNCGEDWVRTPNNHFINAYRRLSKIANQPDRLTIGAAFDVREDYMFSKGKEVIMRNGIAQIGEGYLRRDPLRRKTKFKLIRLVSNTEQGLLEREVFPRWRESD